MLKNDPRRYSHERFNRLVEETVKQINQLSKLKGGEYAGDDDRLANFRRNGQALGLRMETVWAVYAAKHWDAVMQYIKDKQSGKERVRLEGISGRLDDLIVYAILFKAMVDEEERELKGESGEERKNGSTEADSRNKLTLGDMSLRGKQVGISGDD